MEVNTFNNLIKLNIYDYNKKSNRILLELYSNLLRMEKKVHFQKLWMTPSISFYLLLLRMWSTFKLQFLYFYWIKIMGQVFKDGVGWGGGGVLVLLPDIPARSVWFRLSNVNNGTRETGKTRSLKTLPVSAAMPPYSDNVCRRLGGGVRPVAKTWGAAL